MIIIDSRYFTQILFYCIIIITTVNILFQNTPKTTMQTQPATAMSATVTVAEINPIVSIPSGLPIPPNFTTPMDSSMKNLKSEQEAISTQSIPGSSTQTQPANQVNFTGAVGGYTPISSVPHMFPNQPTTSFTPSKYNQILYFNI